MALAHPGLDPWSVALPSPWTAWADRPDGTVLGFLPIVGSLHYNATLSGTGTGEATIAIEESPIDPVEMRRLWSWRLWIMYGGVPVWCGLPTWVKDETGPAVTVGLVELHGYLSKRVFDEPGGPGQSTTYNQVEQTQIARTLALPVQDVGMTIQTTPGPAVYRDRTYEYLEGPKRSDLLQHFCEILQGPEFRAEYELGVQGLPTARLHIAYPRLGLAAPASPLALTVPGNAMGPGITWDGDMMRTRTFAQGDAPERTEQAVDQDPNPRPVVMVDNPQPYVPRLDEVDDWPGVVLDETLRQRANTNAQLYAKPVHQVSGSVFVNDPPFDTYGLGDDVTLLFDDAFTHDDPENLGIGRLVSMDVNPREGTVVWTVQQTSSPPARSRPSNTERIDTLAADQATTFRRGHRHPTFVQSGQQQVTTTSGGIATINFQRPFGGQPRVVFQTIWGTASFFVTTESAPTYVRFAVYDGNWVLRTNYRVEVMWIAHGPH